MFNATFNNISAISWRSVLLVEEPEYLGKTTDLSQIPEKLHHIMCIEYTSSWTGFGRSTLVVIGTDCTGSCTSSYPTITATTAPVSVGGNSVYRYINMQTRKKVDIKFSAQRLECQII